MQHETKLNDTRNPELLRIDDYTPDRTVALDAGSTAS